MTNGSDKRIGDIHISAGDNAQVGDVGHLVINHELAPRCDIVGDWRLPDSPDGIKTWVFQVRLSKPVSRFAMQARSDGLLSLDISRPSDGSGNGSTAKFEVRRFEQPGFREESFASASGEYLITILTRGSPPVIAFHLSP